MHELLRQPFWQCVDSAVLQCPWRCSIQISDLPPPPPPSRGRGGSWSRFLAWGGWSRGPVWVRILQSWLLWPCMPQLHPLGKLYWPESLPWLSADPSPLCPPNSPLHPWSCFPAQLGEQYFFVSCQKLAFDPDSNQALCMFSDRCIRHLHTLSDLISRTSTISLAWKTIQLRLPNTRQMQ